MSYKQELDPPLKIANLSPPGLLEMGLNNAAYVRKVMLHGNQRYSVHRADGQVLCVVKDKPAALAAMLANDLEPVTLH